MIGVYHHVTLRFRILILFFIVVSFYSINWLFNFRVVSYHGISKKSFDSIDENILRSAINHTSENKNMIIKQFPLIAAEGHLNDSFTEIPPVYRSRVNEIDPKKTKYLSQLYENQLTNRNLMNRIHSRKEERLFGPQENINTDKNLDGIGNKRLVTSKTIAKVAGQNVMSDIDKVSHFKNKTNLIQISLDYKPDTGTKSAKVHVISANQDLKKQTNSKHFESKVKKLNSFVDKNTTFPRNQLFQKESNKTFVFNDTKQVMTEILDLNHTFFVRNKTGVQLNKAVNKNDSMTNDFEQSLEYKKFAACQYPLSASNKTKVGILIPSSTRKMLSPSLQNLTLVKISLPSIYKTLEKEYVYRIYIGIDEGDFLQTVQNELQEIFDCVRPVIVQGKNYVKSVNTIAYRAYNDGMDYLVRTNDDTLFITENWTTFAINKLREYHPVNIGVVGPTCNEGNTNILTHDMVHRQHLEIFDFYYPPYLENWWTDDWITRVYEPRKSTKLTTWIVKHVILNTRYTVDFERQKWSKTLIQYDKNRLQKYLGCNCESSVGNPLIHTSVIFTNLLCLVFLFLESCLIQL